jgi:hypothetical protein
VESLSKPPNSFCLPAAQDEHAAMQDETVKEEKVFFKGEMWKEVTATGEKRDEKK